MVLDEEETIFQPLALIGFDNTTRRRLRIPKAIIEQHSGLASGKCTILQGDDRLFLEPFFSVREYGTYSRISLSPLRHEEKIFFLLMTAADEEVQTIPKHLLEFPVEMGVDFFETYIEKIRTLPALPKRKDETSMRKELETLFQQLQTAKKSLLICSITLDTFRKTILPDSTALDPLKFEMDLLRILHSLTHASGFYHRTSQNEVVLAFPSSAIHDRRFLVHHLLASLTDYFPKAALTSSIFRSCTFLHAEEITFDLLVANL